MRDLTAPAPEVVFPEIDPFLTAEIDEALVALANTRSADAAIIARRLVNATADGERPWIVRGFLAQARGYLLALA